jgi:predicted methyltransferase
MECDASPNTLVSNGFFPCKTFVREPGPKARRKLSQIFRRSCIGGSSGRAKLDQTFHWSRIMNGCGLRHGVVVLLAASGWSLQSAAPLNGQQASAAPPTASATHVTRDDWQRVPDILAALGAREGSRVADVGAGEGWLTTRLAKQVGESGRVFAVDIMEVALRSLQRTIESDGLRNVEVILGEEDDPRLPYASLDGIVILNAYHEMPQRGAMLTAFHRALKPGGTLVIVDNAPNDTIAPRQRQTANHQLWLPLAEDDLVGFGFEIVRRDPAFITRQMSAMIHQQWLLVARKGPR